MSDRESAPTTEALLDHMEFLRALARRLVFDEGQAEDVVQDALVVALQDKPRRKSRLRAWLAGIARNLALKSLRTEGRRVRRERAVARAESVTATSEVVARLELHRRVVDEVQRLPEPYRTALVHRYFDGCSVKEIAHLTDTRPKTVETRLRRAVHRLREQLDDAHRGDRRAWCLGLVALVPFSRSAAAATVGAGTAAATTGVIMSSKATVGITTILVAASFFVGWSVKGGPSEDGRATPAREARRAVPLDQHEAVQRQLAAERKKSELLKRELEQIQQESYKAARGEQAEGEDAAKLTGPRFVYGGTVEALNKLDWEVIGESMAKMPGLLDALAKAIEEGKPLEEMGQVIGDVQRWNGPLLTEALKMQNSDIDGTGVNGMFTHPSVMVNIFHAALTKADLPLTEEQERALYDIGLRFTEEDRGRIDGYAEGTINMRKLVEESALKDRFFNEVLGLLDDKQRNKLSPERARGISSVDLFSSGLIYAQVTRPIPFKDRDSLEKGMSARVMNKVKLDEASRPVVEAAVRRWSSAMSDEFLAEPMPPTLGGQVPLHKVDRISKVAAVQAQLMEELGAQLALSDEQRKILSDELAVLVPYREKK